MVGRREPAEQPGPRAPDPLQALDALAAPRSGGRRPPSPQALEVGDELRELRRRQVQVRHLVARLDVLRVARSTRARSSGVFGIVSAASVVRDCRRASGRGRRRRSRVVPRIVWQLAARPARNAAAPRALAAAAGRAGLPGRRARPERGRRLGDDVDRHVRVLEPAELGALAAVAAGCVGVRAGSGSCWPGIVSILRFSSRHPEAVDHVGGRRTTIAPASAPGCGSRSR